jgi:hypothetical protein
MKTPPVLVFTRSKRRIDVEHNVIRFDMRVKAGDFAYNAAILSALLFVLFVLASGAKVRKTGLAVLTFVMLLRVMFCAVGS